MPTPFTHLSLAAEILAAPGLGPGLAEALSDNLPAFLLGNIAPDVQTITGHLRDATHFFPVPLDGAPPAPATFLRHYPALADRDALAASQAAFLAGYMAHLAADQLWVARIFDPVFGEHLTWSTFDERLYLHNALRAHYDAQDLAGLPGHIGPALRRAAPAGWLPFVSDAHLARWRGMVDGQLDGNARTLQVFAERMNADPAAFAALVGSPQAMQRRVFNRLPAEDLPAYRAVTLAASLEVIDAFWNGRGRYPDLL